MLRIHVLRPGGHAYYLDELVPGRAEGSGGVAGEPPGSWRGRAAADLRLAGNVGGHELATLMAGQHPGTGAQLRSTRVNATAGFDLTFGAPKSVSLLRLLAPSEIGTEVGAGHAVAVDDALGYLERAAAGVRRVRGGAARRLGATGLAAAAFVHRTSRTLDPHLHTHLVVANVAQGVDGEWSSLDSRRLFRHSVAARAVYHARLRAELNDRLGVAWEVPPSGMGDVVGVDPTLRRIFSGRSSDIDEHLAVSGSSSSPGSAASSRRVAALVTRPSKDRTRTVEDLVDVWRSRALEFGYPPTELTRVVGLGLGAAPAADQRVLPSDRPGRAHRPRSGPELDRLDRRLRELAGREGGLTRSGLVAEVAAACPAGASAAVVESAADRITRGVLRSKVARGVAGADGRDRRWPAGELADSLGDLFERGASGPSERLAPSSRLGAERDRRVRSRTHEDAGLSLGW